MIERDDITGLVLAGGRGARMGGVDKGLQPHAGVPLALHALRRLAPQVGRMMVNANRNLSAYEALGVPVWPDSTVDYAGPLAGFLAGLEHCETTYLMAVPCDTPRFPSDLVARLADALESAGAEIATVETEAGGCLQPHPVFSLMKIGVRASLARFIGDGQRKIDRWTATQRVIAVRFDDAEAFFNANTTADLQLLQADG